MKRGRLYWITGLSGSGKTTLARRLADHLRAAGQTVVVLDGDDLRQVYGLTGERSFAERAAMGMRHARLCELLTRQGLDVVCATISLNHEVQQWNRRQQNQLTEIVLRSSQASRQQRLSARPGTQAVDGPLMVGHDVKAQWPLRPEVVVDNDGQAGIEPVFQQVMEQLCDETG